MVERWENILFCEKVGPQVNPWQLLTDSLQRTETRLVSINLQITPGADLPTARQLQCKWQIYYHGQKQF